MREEGWGKETTSTENATDAGAAQHLKKVTA